MKALRHLGEITLPVFCRSLRYLNNLLCDIISPLGRVVLLFIYMSILDNVSLDTKAPCEPRQRRTKQLQHNYREALGDAGNASLSRLLTASAGPEGNMYKREDNLQQVDGGGMKEQDWRGRT